MTVPRKKVLIVDDEIDVVNLVRLNLRKAGFDVIEVYNGADALTRAREELPALIVLDWLLPKISGIEVGRILKSDETTTDIPIIFLSAKGEEMDRLTGLEIAEDYVVKPFSARELTLRVVKTLDRSTKPHAGNSLRVGDLELDRLSQQLTNQGEPVSLTSIEYRLLRRLMEEQGRIISREQLLKEIWGYNGFVPTRTIDSHVRRLRSKLGDSAGYLETVRGFGFRFSAHVELAAELA